MVHNPGTESQKKANRVRPPRVKIGLDIETGGAEKLKEVPFVAGVMSDLSGDNLDKQRPMTERKFVEIDRDNFDDVMKRMEPSLNLRVDDKISGEADKEVAVSLKFESMEDFEPAQIVNQVKPLRDLLEARNQLTELAAKADLSPKLEALLEDVLNNPAKLDELRDELNKASSE